MQLPSFSPTDRVKRLIELLEHYCPNPQVPLHYRDPFTLLVAVCLSAQCRDERVNAVTPALFELAPDPWALAQLEPSQLEPLIRTCGMAPTRSKRLIAMARQLCEQHGGCLPRELQLLEALPGVGHKSASVVLVTALGQPAFPVDTHILRCAKRWGLSAHTSVEGVERDLKGLFPPASWGRRHLQMVLVARHYCQARAHHPAHCPICSQLAASDALDTY